MRSNNNSRHTTKSVVSFENDFKIPLYPIKIPRQFGFHMYAVVEERLFSTRRRWSVVYHEIVWEQGENGWMQTRERLKKYLAWVACESVSWERQWAQKRARAPCWLYASNLIFESVNDWIRILRCERRQRSKANGEGWCEPRDVVCGNWKYLKVLKVNWEDRKWKRRGK